MDALVEAGVYSSRSDALRYGARMVVREERPARLHEEIFETEVELVPLDSAVMDAAAELRASYDAVNVFDAIHLGTAMVLDAPIVSTDTLFPGVEEVEHVDPRET